jgi:hypothetical protein
VGDRDVSVAGTTIARECCSVYGIRVTSDIPLGLSCDEENSGTRSLAAVSFVDGAEDHFDGFATARTDGESFVFDEAPDGTAYLRWRHLYEFAVAADGSRVTCRPLDGCDVSVLQNFLFGQVLAVALVRQGIEPLHAAVIAIGGAAIAFLGDCGYGKSTLLASFTDAGYRSVTDDMLILDRHNGELLAVPGPGRVKLLPDSARLFFEDVAGVRLTASTQKRAFTFHDSKQQRSTVPLRMLYVLPTPAERESTRSIEIRPVSRAAVVPAIVANTFTTQVVSRARLARQFEHATAVASGVDAFQLHYPAGLDHLPAIGRAIVEHSRRWLTRHTSMTESL